MDFKGEVSRLWDWSLRFRAVAELECGAARVQGMGFLEIGFRVELALL